MKFFRIRVSGKVQGVYFRESTKAKALELGLAGKVKNQEDGSVLIMVEGPEMKVKELVEWCHVGPPAARVDLVEILETGQVQGFTSFAVER